MSIAEDRAVPLAAADDVFAEPGLAPAPARDEAAVFTGLGLTYDDVLLLPSDTDVVPSEVDTTSWLTRRIQVSTPVVSAAMDTVTEARMAIAMARQGGIGVLHRNLSIEDQAYQVDLVKRTQTGMISNPVVIGPDATLEQLDELCGRYRVSGLPVVDGDERLIRIVTNRDLRFTPVGTWTTTLVRDVMTPMPLVTAPEGISREDATALLRQHKRERLPIVDADGRLVGLITVKDFVKSEQFPNASKDADGRLMVGAAIGYFGDAWERATTLVEAGVDVLVADTAHGHQDKMIDTIKTLCALDLGLPLAAGNVVSAQGARDLIDAGASIVKVGVGPGAMCTTRMMTGVGRPQFSAVLECASAARELGGHVWADGGVRHPRDVALALAAGASNVMIGSWFAGTYESPGDLMLDRDNHPYKESYGMASKRAVAAHTSGDSPFDHARKNYRQNKSHSKKQQNARP